MAIWQKTLSSAIVISLIIVSALSGCSPAPGPQPVGPATAPAPASTQQTIALLPSPSPSPTPNRAMITVNGEGIEKDGFAAQVEQVEAAKRALAPWSGLGLPALPPADPVSEEFILETLLAQEAEAAGQAISDSQLALAEDRLAARIGGKGKLQSWETTNGYTPASFRAALRLALLAAWQRDRILDLTPLRAEQVRGRLITFTSRAGAQGALARLMSGEVDFLSLAGERDPQTQGDLGWFPRGSLTEPRLEAVAFSLQPGQTSEIVETGLGWHILQVTARQEDRLLTPGARLALQRLALRDWLAKQRLDSQVEAPQNNGSLPSPQPTSEGSLSVFTVQPGDSLASIAVRFGFSPEELLAANPQAREGMLWEGDDLNIPVNGIPIAIDSPEPVRLILETAAADESLPAAARRRGLKEAGLIRLNRLASPEQVYAGRELAVPEGSAPDWKALLALQEGQTALEAAVLQGVSPWLLSFANQAAAPSLLLPGEPLYLPAQVSLAEGEPASLIAAFSMQPPELVQGGTSEIRVRLNHPGSLTGQLDGRQLHFIQEDNGEWIAIQGIHCLAEPGLIDFSLAATTTDGQAQTLDERLILASGHFITDPPLTVDPATLDPAVTKEEEDLLARLTAAVTPTRYWSHPFGRPVSPGDCNASGYGNRRTYNDSPLTYFHGGLDFGLCSSLNIFAPAPGVVVFAGPLTVRGNATIIDHGWGIYSGFYHQEQVLVKVGDVVEQGQLIGIMGATGRVTGVHLHWEVWAAGVQVNPLEWIGRLIGQAGE